MPGRKTPVIFCELLPETRAQIEAFAEALKEQAPNIGGHGLSEQEFWDAGILRAAIEKLRGTQAASMVEKRAFMAGVLQHLQELGEISRWTFTGAGERHDYQIDMPSGRISIVETKGCLDGNNTNIFERPPQADEFIIWSLCQNPGSDPRHNAWSGLHTRLGAEIIHRRTKVDGVVIWDMVCGTRGRPCPKLARDANRATTIRVQEGPLDEFLGRGPIERTVPPPCIYLFPRSVPDPRNNPTPACWRLEEVELLHALHRAFKGDEADVVEVYIESRMTGVNVERQTRFFRTGVEFSTSQWTTLRRAR